MNEVNFQLENVFQALSDTTRLRMISLLLQTGAELCLCDFRETMNEPEYKLSRQLKVLKNAGLINSVRDGKWIYHNLVGDNESLKLILRAIESNPPSVQFRKDLARFKRLKSPREKGRCRESAQSSTAVGMI